MLSFWIICALLIIMALVIILPSLLSKEIQADVDRKKINQAVYEKKLAELEKDYENDLIDDEQLEIAKLDLKHTLLDDIEDQKEKQIKSGNFIMPITIILVIPLVAILVYINLDNGLASLSPEFNAQLQTQQAGEKLSVEKAITSLKQKLQQDPNNLDNWLLLGKSLLVSEKFPEAVVAYERANEISNGSNPNVLVAYGEAQGFAAGQNFDNNSLALFTKALQIDPKHERALWYAGLASYQLQKYESSAGYWQRLLERVPNDQQEVKTALLAYLNDAKQKAGIEVADAAGGTENQPSIQNEDTNKAAIVVNVTLNDNLKEKVNVSDTLFIYARAINGPKMPLALIRLSANDLPTTVNLDDSTAMMPSMTLSSQKEVEVIARISKTGQAITQPGDLLGSTKPVITNASEKVNIEINQQAP